MHNLFKLLSLAIGPVIIVGSTILNGVAVIQLGLPLWAYQALGVAIFAFALIRIVLQSQNGSVTKFVSDSSAGAVKGDSAYSRPFTNRELAHITTMSNSLIFSHGHSDLQGLMETILKGKMLTNKNCYECGEPRLGSAFGSVDQSRTITTGTMSHLMADDSIERVYRFSEGDRDFLRELAH
jgi:hypothetical protein